MYVDESKYGTQSTNHHDDYKSMCLNLGWMKNQRNKTEKQ